MSKLKEALIFVVLGGGTSPGGFCVPKLGPDKVTKAPGEEFPASWMNEGTLKALVKDGHVKYVETDSDEDAGEASAEAPKASVAGDESKDLKEFCIFANSDLNGMSRGDLDNIVSDVCAQAGVEVPDLANIDAVKEFLTQGEAE